MKKLLFLLSFFVLLLSVQTHTYAGDITESGPKYDRMAFYLGPGFPDSWIGSNAYYEDPSIAEYGYSWHTSTARSNWDAAGSANIGWYKASGYSTAYTRFYAGAYTWASYWGKMQAYKSDGTPVTDAELNETGVYWYRAHVLLNDYEMDRDGFSGTKRAHVAVHEVGHVLNMDHQADTVDSIMKAHTFLDNSYTPTSLDYRNVNYMY